MCELYFDQLGEVALCLLQDNLSQRIDDIETGFHLIHYEDYYEFVHKGIFHRDIDALRLTMLDNIMDLKIEDILRKVDIYSLGTHSRRSWLLFQYVFNPDIAVGIVSIESRSYDSGKWWKSSSGVRSVLSETIAYFYARFIFSP